MADISSIKVGSTTYNIKDTTARSSASSNSAAISNIQSDITQLQNNSFDLLTNDPSTDSVTITATRSGYGTKPSDTTIKAATTSQAGVMTAAMVTKLNSLQAVAGKAMSMIGVTSTTITDGLSSATELIAASTGSLAKTKGFVQGDVVIVQNASSTANGKEFVCVADKWVEFGDTSHLGAMASWNSAKGSVSIPTTGHTHSVSIPAMSHSVTQGTVSASGSYTPGGTVTVNNRYNSSGNYVYVPYMNMSAPQIVSLAHQEQFNTNTITPVGGTTSVIGSISGGAAPTGSKGAIVTAVTGGSCSATGAVSNVYTPTATGTWPSCSVSGEVLTISTGTAPTWGSAHTVIGGVSYTAPTATVSNDYYRITGLGSSVSSSAKTVATAGTTISNVATITKYSTDADSGTHMNISDYLSASFKGASSTVSVSGKTSGVAVANHAATTATAAATGNTTSATVSISKLS